MKKIKYIVSVMLCFILCFSLGQCSNKKKETDRAKGRYIEQEYDFPNNLEYVYDMKETNSSNILLLGINNSNKFCEYISKDGGKSFSNITNNLNDLIKEENCETVSFKISDENTIYVLVLIKKDKYKENINIDEIKNKEDYVELKEYKITNNLKCEEIKLDGSLIEYCYDIKMDDSGNIYYTDYNTNKIKCIDGSTGIEKGEISCDDYNYIFSLYVLKEKIIIITDENIVCYDLKTLKKKYITKDLNDYNNDDINIVDGENENVIYFFNNDGLFRYVFGGKIVEQVIDGSLSSFGEYGSSSQVIEKNNNEFLAVHYGDKNSLKNYKYSKEEDSVPSKRITIYSLYSDDYIKQVIYNYQKKNKDIYIKYEVGVNGDISEEEAVKKLELNIMQNKGPDIVILDGFNSYNLRKKHVFCNLTDIIYKNPYLYDNIVSSYKDNNNIYSFPLRIAIPITISKCNINNMDSILSNIHNDNNENYILDVNNPKVLINYLFYRCNYNWFNKDNSVNNENLKKFLNETKIIYENYLSNKDSTNEDEYKDYTNSDFNFYLNGDGIYENNMSNKIKLYQITTLNDFALLDNKKNKINYSLWEESEGIFTPIDEMAITLNCKNKDECKKFFEFALSKNVINNEFYLYPSKKLNKEYVSSKYNGEMETLHYESFGEPKVYYIKEINNKDINKYSKEIEGLKTKSNTDIVTLNKIIDDMSDYILGNKSIDDTLKAINKKLM